MLQCGEMHISSFGYLSVMVLGSRKYFARKEDNVRNPRANYKDKKDTRKGGLKTGLRLSDSYPTNEFYLSLNLTNCVRQVPS